jgi:hypothetical protein
MTPEEFCALPSSVALRILHDGSAAVQKLVAAAEAPKSPRSPRYDLKIHRKGGHNWASELTLESLEWWHKRAIESAAQGGEWAERDTKRASQLDYWIAWRKWEPEAIWTGTRGDVQTTARPPSESPELHSQMPTNERQPGDDASADW